MIQTDLNNQDMNSNEPYNVNFSLFELELALNSSKNSAPGGDAIHYEMLKKLPNNAKIALLALFNQSWKEGTSPDEWSQATIIPILKPGKDKQDPKSYRPISLTSCLSKTMQRMIKARLVNYVE